MSPSPSLDSCKHPNEVTTTSLWLITIFNHHPLLAAKHSPQSNRTAISRSSNAIHVLDINLPEGSSHKRTTAYPTMIRYGILRTISLQVFCVCLHNYHIRKGHGMTRILRTSIQYLNVATMQTPDVHDSHKLMALHFEKHPSQLSDLDVRYEHILFGLTRTISPPFVRN